MFPYIGIMADEEPKDSISPSGLYNTSDLGSLTGSGSDLSSTILGGRSELTLMTWLNVDDFSLFTSTGVRPFVEFNPTSYPISFGSNAISSQIRNSNGGNTVVSAFDTFLENAFYHVCITQSLLNNRIRVYVNGVLLNSGTMSYPNDNTATTFRIQKQDGVSLAQFNAYDRELSESEVAEHYVYDDDLLFAGVLGYDAMTASQRDGLVYSSSYTKDISITGNEFTDKSGNGVTLSPQPTLTGQQIYFYTDANDLPNGGGVQIYPVNSIKYSGAGTDYHVATSDNIVGSSAFTLYGWVMPVGTGYVQMIYAENLNTDGGFKLLYRITSTNKLEIRIAYQVGGTFSYSSTASLTTNEPNFVSVTFVTNGDIVLGVNGTYETFSAQNSTVNSAVGIAPPSVGVLKYPSGVLQPLNGGISFLGGSGSVAFSQADLETIRNSVNPDTALCYASYPQAIKDKHGFHWSLATYTGSPSQTEDQAGTNDLTTIGAPTNTDQGLSVECGGTPTAPSNALPSNLPTIL